MDLSSAFEEVRLRDQREEIRVKDLLELSSKKYSMEKELETLKTKLSVGESGLKKLRNSAVRLSYEVPVLEKQRVVAKDALESLVKEAIAKQSEVIQIQETFWANINNFVDKGNALLAKFDAAGRETKPNADAERQKRIELLKIQSENEALHLYEEYQQRKIEELQLIETVLQNDALEI